MAFLNLVKDLRSIICKLDREEEPPAKEIRKQRDFCSETRVNKSQPGAAGLKQFFSSSIFSSSEIVPTALVEPRGLKNKDINHYIIPNNGILKSNSTVFPRSKGCTLHKESRKQKYSMYF